jgi:hypothetical protein
MSESNQQEAIGVDPMASFFTRPVANEGIEFPLVQPDGTKTKHWLRLRGIDSDEYRLADLDTKRRSVKIAAIEDEKKRDEAIYELTLHLCAVLVLSWSFDKPCTLDNVVAFLREAPQIASAIENVSGNRRLFFGIASSNSPASQSTSTAST